MFADAWSAVVVADPYPGASETFGRYLGLKVLRETHLPLATRVLALADNTHVTNEGEDHAVSDSISGKQKRFTCRHRRTSRTRPRAQHKG